MEQIVFERPREKLQQHGVTSLTNGELLQVIIGSGSSQTPVAKIARQISRQLDTIRDTISYKVLMKVEGVGIANALRVVAALELGRRLSTPKNAVSSIDPAPLRKSRQRTVVYETVDGNGQVVTTQVHSIKTQQAASVLARQICAKVLSDNAWGVRVAMGYSKAPRQPGMYELALTSDVKELSRHLQIKLVSVEYISKTAVTSLYKAVV